MKRISGVSVTVSALAVAGAFTLTAMDTLTLLFDGSKKLQVYLPAFMGTTQTLTLYIASDGSTYYDAALTMVARLRPAG